MDAITQLLRWKADPGVADPVYGINSMHIACHFANEHAARLFIDAGVWFACFRCRESVGAIFFIDALSWFAVAGSVLFPGAGPNLKIWRPKLPYDSF